MIAYLSTATAKDGAAEAAAAGDFGCSTDPATSLGNDVCIEIAIRRGEAYLRLWNRDASGRWWVMADVAQPSKQ